MMHAAGNDTAGPVNGLATLLAPPSLTLTLLGRDLENVNRSQVWPLWTRSRGTQLSGFGSLDADAAIGDSTNLT